MQNNTISFRKGQVVQIEGIVFKIQHVGIRKLVLRPVKPGVIKECQPAHP